MPCRPSLLFAATLLFVTVGFSPAAAKAPPRDDLAAVRQAAAMLREFTWAEVIEINNDRRTREYGTRVYATVFEFNDIIWFYTPSEGTQNLSLYRGRVNEDRENLGPLLEAIHPGFGRFRTLALTSADLAGISPTEGRTPGRWKQLRNGCFVESVHELQRLRTEGTLLTDARLLMYYVKKGFRQMGHTVLVYATPSGRFGWDPARPQLDIELDRAEASAHPLQVARYFTPLEVAADLASARFLPVKSLTLAATVLASHDREPSRGEAARIQ